MIRFPSLPRPAITSLALLAPALLGGCNTVVLAPAGDVAAQQGNLVVIATLLMLIIIVPVMALIALFAWRYRHSNKEAAYSPDWHHSTALELVIWAVPLLIIICLGAVTWTSTHLLDPYRPIGRIDATRAIAADAKPIRVQVVALDWKWLFIYPDYGIASVNQLAAPINQPIEFDLTSSDVMNAFYIPDLAGMIYAMPSMVTKLHAVANKPGNYAGFSSNFSGDGFSYMKFRFLAGSQTDFDGWVAKVRANGTMLDRATYLKLAKPSMNHTPAFYAGVAPGLFNAAANNCVAPGQVCMDAMMRADAGPHRAEHAEGHAKNDDAMKMSAMPMPMAKADAPAAVSDSTAKNSAQSTARLAGAGLPMPGDRRTF
ncbi:ubiquinol oxidase subunit II [Sphingomonas sp. RB3P16]|uniref:ubiquinol oxidase subunit II n=1 Tax=Parasphingomonas frigoris TaxID=3096163 RepID=UPI002FCADD80